MAALIAAAPTYVPGFPDTLGRQAYFSIDSLRVDFAPLLAAYLLCLAFMPEWDAAPADFELRTGQRPDA